MDTVKTSELVFRPATRDDLPFVAWCNYEASSPYPGFCYWDPLLQGTNTPTMSFIEAVFHNDALAWGRVEDFMLVEENGKLIAGASGFEMNPHDYRPLRLDRLPLVAQALHWDQTMLEGFIGGYQAVWSDPLDTTLAPSATWIIECVAVVPEARGRGVGKQLIRALLDKGAQLDHSHAGISVTSGNASAQRVYEAVGFKMYITYGTEYFDNQYPGSIKYRTALPLN